MADKSLKPKNSWAPMIAFLGVVGGIVVLLWWMSRPSVPSPSTDSGSTSPAITSAPRASMASGAPGAPPSMTRELCSVADVKKFIASQLAAGEVPDAELQQVAVQMMSMLAQAGLAEKGCVSPADVTAALYDMAEDEGEEER
jgi:hypothetical protein